jgi:predicted permease
MRTLATDFFHTLRALRKAPGISVLAVLALALGIGANSVIFSFVDAILLRPLPVARPSELVRLNQISPDGPSRSFSYLEYQDLRSQSRTLSGLAAFGMRGVIITLNGPPFLATVCVVSPDYFPFLGINAEVGRLFGEETGAPNRALVAILSHRFWQKRFGRDAGVIGKPLHINRLLCTVEGIATRGFRGTELGEEPDLWIPVSGWTQLTGEEQTQRKYRWMGLIGRLRQGTSLRQAEKELDLIRKQWESADSSLYKDVLFSLLTEFQARGEWPRILGGLLVLLAVLVLLIACVDVASLLMAHLNSRRREIAIRMSLGASRVRIFGLVVMEIFVLAVFGTLLAFLLSAWLIHALPALMTSIPFASQWDVRLDTRVVGFTLAISLLAVLGSAAVPAFKMIRQNLNQTLRDYASTTFNPLRGRSLSAILIVSQLAFTAVLLVSAGLLTRTFWNVRNLDPGFRSNNRLLVWILPGIQGYSDVQLQSFYHELLTRVQGLPGVLNTSLVQRPPLYPTEGGQSYAVKIPGREEDRYKDLEVRYTLVWPNYFAVMETPFLRGQSFSGQETAAGPGCVIINETMARQFWPGQDPIGRRITVRRGDKWKDCEIIGVVRDGKYVNLRETTYPYMYLPLVQWDSAEMTLLVHTSSDAHALAGAVQRELRRLSPSLPEPEVSTLDEQLEQARSDERVAASLVGALSGLAVCLALSGLYGLLSYSVRQRTREIGIRISLGAQTGTILELVLLQGLRLVVCGTALGLIAAFMAARLLASQVYGIRARDPLTFAGVAVLLAAISLIACLVPARRASRVDPSEALRQE